MDLSLTHFPPIDLFTFGFEMYHERQFNYIECDVIGVLPVFQNFEVVQDEKIEIIFADYALGTRMWDPTVWI